MTFLHRPDVLDLVIDIDSYSELSVSNTASPYGQTNERFLFLGDCLLGQELNFDSWEYYRGLDVEVLKKRCFSLAPALRNMSTSILPSVNQFCVGLSAFLDMGREFVLICERDCEQESVEKLTWNTSEGKNRVKQLEGYLNGLLACPTFLLEGTKT